MKYLEMKKRAFMSIVNAVKGFVRTISGTPPLTLPECVDNDSLIGYSISGNSVQNGEPTPENPIEVESVGDYDVETGKYKIPIKINGKNLIDKESILTNIYFKRNGDIFISNRGICADRVVWSCNVSVLDAGNYVLSADVKQADITTDPSASTVILGVRSNSETIKQKYNTVVREEWVRVNLEFTLTESIENFKFQIQPLGTAGKFDNLNLQIKNIQLEKSNTMGDYEPYIEPITTNIYLDEPLRKIGAYADYIDFENQKIVRKVGCYTFKGTETIEIPGSTITGHTPFRFYGISEARQPFVCNYLPYVALNYADVNSKPRECLAKYATGNQMFFIISNDRVPLNDTASFKALLAELYQNNVPYIVFYVKAGYYEKTIELPKILTHKGTTVYSIETAIQPTNMSATYYSTMKE